MFLTITPNASLDRLLFIRQFEPATTMRTHKEIDVVGGKGFDISVALRCLGQETTAVGFLAGKIGATLIDLVSAYGIQTDLVSVEGETRISHVVIEEDLHRHSHIVTQGHKVTPEKYQSLLDIFSSRLPQAAWAASAGSLPEGIPQDFFQVIARLAREKNVPVLVDTAGQPAHLAILARPDILKMNHQEFQATFGENPTSIEQLARSAVEIARANGMNSFVITCGREGILAITPPGNFLAQAPALQAVNAAGAGDAVSAALMWRLSQGDDWSEALRWAAAAGAATVLTEATAESDWQTVQKLVSQVTVKKL